MLIFRKARGKISEIIKRCKKFTCAFAIKFIISANK